jgi:hypothetical protein
MDIYWVWRCRPYNTNILEAEVEGFWVWGQPGLYRWDTVSKNNNQKNYRHSWTSFCVDTGLQFSDNHTPPSICFLHRLKMVTVPLELWLWLQLQRGTFILGFISMPLISLRQFHLEF